MLYLLDANVLIHAHRQYYPIDMVPEFWSWLIHMGECGIIKIPIEIHEEVIDGTDDLARWADTQQVHDALRLVEEVDVGVVASIVSQGYASDLNDVEIEEIGRDPFLIAYAALNPDGRRIVTTETSRPSKQRANKKVPDVARLFGVATINTFQLVKELNFRTGWSSSR